MKKAKKVFALVLAFALCITATIGATVAYLTDTDDEVNTFTVGNVQIELVEEQRVTDEDGNRSYDNLEKFVDNKQLDPIVIPEGGTKYDSVNYVDKIVSVKNTGVNEAYMRIVFAIPVVEGYDEKVSQSDNWLHWNVYSHTDTKDEQGEGTNGWFWGTEETGEYPADVNDWNSVKGEDGKPQVVTIEGKKYMLYIATNVLPIAPNGGQTEASLRGLFLDSRVDCEVVDGVVNHYITINGTKHDLGDLSKLDIKVFAQAVQTAGFETAWDAFEAAAMPTNPWAE